MVILCYLCDSKASKTSNISLHRFPKNVDIRAKWLNACGLTTNDDLKRLSICSRHFEPEDICLGNIFGKVKSSIKRNAVPKLFLTNPINIEEILKSTLKTPLRGIFDQATPFFSNTNVADDKKVLDISRMPPKKSNLNNARSREARRKRAKRALLLCSDNSIDVPMRNDSSINTIHPDEKDNLNSSIENRMADLNSDGGHIASNNENSATQSRNRRFFQPLRVNEIQPSDFSTLKRAKRRIEIIRKTCQSYLRKIKQLQRQAKNLQKRVQYLQDLVNHLERELYVN